MACPRRHAPRALAMASISSMNTTHGASDRAFANKVRTRAEPRPTKSSTNAEPEHDRNSQSASSATHLANNVLPVPDGPVSRMPRGHRAPMRAKAAGSRRQATTSRSSRRALSTPATPAKPRFRSLFFRCWFATESSLRGGKFR